MKKLFTVAIMIAMLACIFVICASATEIDGVHYSLNTTLKTATVSADNVNCTLENVVIPSTVTYEGITYDVTAIASHAFAGSGWNGRTSTPAAKTVTLPSSITSFGDHVFRLNKNIEEVIINCDITGLNDAVFYQSSVKKVTFNCPNLKTFTKHIFEGCSSLTTVSGLPEGMTTIGNNVFKGCSSLSSIYIPTTITTLGSWAFNSCRSLTGTLYLPNATFLGGNSLQSTSFDVAILPKVVSAEKDVFNSSKIEVVVLSHDVSAFTSSFFSSCSYLRAIIYLGEDGNDVKNELSNLGSFTVKSFAEFDATVDYGAGSNKIIFAGAKHIGEDAFVYFDSYDKPFFVWNAKTNTAVDYNPIITHIGFSVNPENPNSIATGYKIDSVSLEAYEAIYGELGFGVFIFNPKYLGNDSFFVTDENGTKLNVSKGVVEVPIDTKYSTCSVYVNGFGDAHKELELVFAGYAFVEGKREETLDFVQKNYTGTEEAPVNSPMGSIVTRNGMTLYTVTLQGILTPEQITTGKEGLDEYQA